MKSLRCCHIQCDELIPCGFVCARNGMWVGFVGVLPFFHATNFIPPFLHTHLIRFISSVPVMVRQVWSAGIRAIHRPSIKGLHRISSLDPRLGPVSDKKICEKKIKVKKGIVFAGIEFAGALYARRGIWRYRRANVTLYSLEFQQQH